MARFENDDGSLKRVCNEVISKYFPNFSDLMVKVKLIFDTKKVTRHGKIVLGSCKLTNEMLKYLTEAEIEEGYDYFIIINKKAWELADKKDKIRLLRHELRHIFIDEKGNFKVAPHDIEDFSEEIELNKDNPNWALNLALMVEAAYDAE